jgi:DNA-directed RNA polymerase subunit alpha
VRDLVQCSEVDLLKLRSFGKTSLREVKRKLSDIGLSLGMRVSGATPPTIPESAMAGPSDVDTDGDEDEPV